MAAFYNEIDPKAAASLRELIAQELIAPGVVDERDIQDISPAELRGFSQCHFFAGIGVWSYALRRAGWPDDRPVWTGSCPCQPFSAAGKGAGFDDERHLWPSWYWLIDQCRPAIVFGEQVASKDADPWIDLVQADLEALGYALGAVPFPSAGIGAPHIRDRLYWVADAGRSRQLPAAHAGIHCREESPGSWHGEPQRHSDGVGLADASGARLALGSIADDGRRALRIEGSPIATDELLGRLADPCGGDASKERQQRGREQRQQSQDGGYGRLVDADGAGRQPWQRNDPTAGHRPPSTAAGGNDRPGPTNGLWRDADWLFCRDGKWRPVEPGTFPLAHGSPARVGRLRGYGNAINAEAATAFIESCIETEAA